MDKNRTSGASGGAGGPWEKAIEQYTLELMAVYRRQRQGATGQDTPAQAAEEMAKSSAIQAAVRAAVEAVEAEEARREPAPGPVAASAPAQEAENPCFQCSHRPGLWEEPAPEPGATAPCFRCDGRPAGEGDTPAQRGKSRAAAPARTQEARPVMARPEPASREEVNTAGDASGTPVDAIGQPEADYLARCAATLQGLKGPDSTYHTTSMPNSQPQDAPQGSIKTQVFTARRTYPVPGAKVDLYQADEGGFALIDSQYTDQSGQTRPVRVPALDKELSEHPGNGQPYVSYRIIVSHPSFVQAIMDGVSVFQDVVSIQSVDLVPLPAEPVPHTGYQEYAAPGRNGL